jgi:predicted dehydrogenase
MTFSWAVVGPGGIARRFAEAVRGIEGAHILAVCGRDVERALQFASHCAAPQGKKSRATARIIDILTDPDIDGIYIATPHAHHLDPIERCLIAGKPVLCEKPLVVNTAQAKTIINLAQSRQVFLMEAFWTRFLPIYDVVGEWLEHGAIGRVRHIQSNFCFQTPFDPLHRLFNPSLAGGSLLDVGVYNLAMTRWALEKALQQKCPEPLEIVARAAHAPSGVDIRVVSTLVFPDDVTAQFVCGFDTQSEGALYIYGDKGTITIPSRFWEGQEATLTRQGLSPINERRPFRINGFEYEIEAAMQAITSGLNECSAMSLDDSCTVIGWMDIIRHKIGVSYPFEN